MLFSGKKLFEMRDTHGVPLSICIDVIYLQHRGIVSWDWFVEAALNKGWNLFKIRATIREAITDSDLDLQYKTGMIAAMEAMMDRLDQRRAELDLLASQRSATSDNPVSPG